MNWKSGFLGLWIGVVMIGTMSCTKHNPVAPSAIPEQGQMSFALEVLSAGAANIARGTVTITKGALTQSQSVIMAQAAGSVAFSNLQVGAWAIAVKLFDRDGVEIYAGSGSGLVVRNQTTVMKIRVDPQTGCLQINLVLPSAMLIEDVAFTDDKGIWRIHADGTGRQNLVWSYGHIGERSGNISFGANAYRGGRTWLFVNRDWSFSSSPAIHIRYFLRTMNPDGSNVRDILASSGSQYEYFNDPRWSWNGSRIAYGHIVPMGSYQGHEWPETDSVRVLTAAGGYLMDSQSGNLSGVYAGHDANPVWTPNDCLVYAHYMQLGAPKALCLMNADGTARRTILDLSWDATPTDCAPDGTVLFSSAHSGNQELYKIKTDGTELMQLTHEPGSDTCGRFNGDGTKIVFQSDRRGAPGIYVMEQDGSHQAYLADGTNPFCQY